MSRLTNAAIRGDIQRAVSASRKDLEKLVRETSGADSEPVRKSASVLRREWRDVLSVPSANLGPDMANAPPRMRTEKLRRSIRNAVVDGIRRIGTDSFVARLLEFGGYLTRTSKKGNASAPVPQPPRPHASVALTRAESKMVDVVVSEMQTRISRGVK